MKKLKDILSILLKKRSIFLIFLFALSSQSFASSPDLLDIDIKCRASIPEKAEIKAKRLLFDNLTKQINNNKILFLASYAILFNESKQYLNYDEIQKKIIDKFPLQISSDFSKLDCYAEYHISAKALEDQFKLLSSYHFQKAQIFYQQYKSTYGSSFEKDLFIVKTIDELVNCIILNDLEYKQSTEMLSEFEALLNRINLINPPSDLLTQSPVKEYKFKLLYSLNNQSYPIKNALVILKFKDHLEKLNTNIHGIASFKINSIPASFTYELSFENQFNDLELFNKQFIEYMFVIRKPNFQGSIKQSVLNNLKLFIDNRDFDEKQINHLKNTLINRGYQAVNDRSLADQICVIRIHTLEEKILSLGSFYIKANLIIEIKSKSGDVLEKISSNTEECFSNKSKQDAFQKLKLRLIKQMDSIAWN